MIPIAVGYELKYWLRHKKEDYHAKAQLMKDLFNLDQRVGVLADVGCGPICGILNVCKADIMYAVDPLWDVYKDKGVARIPENVQTISASADSFVLPNKADIILSVNSLDHSGNLKKSIENIMLQIKETGVFCMHIHLRNKSQLNKGHKMLVREEDLDSYLSCFKIRHKEIHSSCPLSGDPYKSYVCEITH